MHIINLRNGKNVSSFNYLVFFTSSWVGSIVLGPPLVSFKSFDGMNGQDFISFSSFIFINFSVSAVPSWETHLLNNNITFGCICDVYIAFCTYCRQWKDIVLMIIDVHTCAIASFFVHGFQSLKKNGWMNLCQM